jgi:hypothetical protein
MKIKLHLIRLCLLVAALIAAFTGNAQVVTKIATANANTIYLMSDGSFWGAGENETGELGD